MKLATGKFSLISRLQLTLSAAKNVCCREALKDGNNLIVSLLQLHETKTPETPKGVNPPEVIKFHNPCKIQAPLAEQC